MMKTQTISVKIEENGDFMSEPKEGNDGEFLQTKFDLLLEECIDSLESDGLHIIGLNIYVSGAYLVAIIQYTDIDPRTAQRVVAPDLKLV